MSLKETLKNATMDSFGKEICSVRTEAPQSTGICTHVFMGLWKLRKNAIYRDSTLIWQDNSPLKQFKRYPEYRVKETNRKFSLQGMCKNLSRASGLHIAIKKLGEYLCL